MPRPKLDIDSDEVYKLAKYGASNVDIAEFFGCAESTIRGRFCESVDKGRAERRITLHRKQYEVAEAGNVAMLIWLGKQVLGQADKLETKNDTRTRVDPDEQRNMVGNPKALQHACDLEAEIINGQRNGTAPGHDSCWVRPSDQ